MSEWISVEDRLPSPKGQFCDVWIKSLDNPDYESRQTHILFASGIFNIDMYYHRIYVSHWMPLPEPPK